MLKRIGDQILERDNAVFYAWDGVESSKASQGLNYLWDDAFSVRLTKDGYTLRAGEKSSRIFVLENHENLTSAQDYVNVWKIVGRKPNVIIGDFSEYDRFKEICSKLNAKKEVNGRVVCNDLDLKNVKWESSDAISTGEFSFPVDGQKKTYAKPYKRGFVFSPSKIFAHKDSFWHVRAIEMKLKDSLYANYKLDGSAQDLKGNTLPVLFRPSFVDEAVRGKVALFSSRDRLSLQNEKGRALLMEEALSLSFWFKVKHYPSGDNNLAFFRSKEGQGFGVKLRKRRPVLFLGTEEQESEITIDYGWHHVALSLDADELTFVLDGAASLRIKDTEKAFPFEGDLVFGAVESTVFSGYLDDVKLHKRALSVTELKRMMELEEKKPSLEADLVGYYPLRKNTESYLGKALNGKPNNIDFTSDDRFGEVARFEKDSSFIDCGHDAVFDINNCLTVTAWVKPTLLNDHIAIVGKGYSYSAKFWNKKMLFTTTFVSDHYGASSRMKLDEWQHVSYVFDAGDRIRFYYNGELVHESIASPINSSDNSFLIGSNLWGQYFKGNMTELCLWNRSLSTDEIKEVYRRTKDGGPVFRIPEVIPPDEPETQTDDTILVVSGGVLLLFAAFWFFYKKKNKERNSDKVAEVEKPIAKVERKINGNSLEFFGGFKACDATGNDVSRKFTPKLRELFLLMFLEGRMSGKGISSKRISDTLWAGYPESSAKNSRSTYMRNLRAVLSDFEGIEVVFENKYWQIQVSEKAFCDIEVLWSLLRDGLDWSNGVGESELDAYLEVLLKGKFLPSLEAEWADSFKANLADKVTDLCDFVLASDLYVEDRKMAIAKALENYDSLNYGALAFKLSYYVNHRKRSVAVKIFEKFVKEHHDFYGYEPELTFEEALRGPTERV
ncbi:LamG-like jellyroll fold domain-containing protein [Fulvitalea axinellae]|uniref:LamG-like jellyroll fold domain-containing protein n=1 Tax=Fulvitalea axinellae TaxID=1182444 RepID=UPI0030CA2145